MDQIGYGRLACPAARCFVNGLSRSCLSLAPSSVIILSITVTLECFLALLSSETPAASGAKIARQLPRHGNRERQTECDLATRSRRSAHVRLPEPLRLASGGFGNDCGAGDRERDTAGAPSLFLKGQGAG